MDADVVWKEFCKYCIEKIGVSDKSVEYYLKTCLPVSAENDALTLDVANSFSKEQIKSRYLSRMNELFAECGLGKEIILKVSNEDSAKERRGEDENRIKNKERFAVKNGLNPNYVFSNFIVGASNRLAHAASLAVADSPGAGYNPLFIWGNVGLGKTHLMHSIGNRILENNQSLRVLYTNAERFTNDWISSIKVNKCDDFREKYRNVDALMIDDVQFIAGKESTMEEFFWTFNSLHDEKKQIIISADRPPKDIPDIESRLVNRFEWGLVAGIQPPDLETRVAILQKKAEMKNYENIPDDVIMFIAQNIPSNIRELEGALNRITACSDMNKEPITLEKAAAWIKDLIRERRNGGATIDIIQQLTAEALGVTVNDIISDSRKQGFVLARHIAMYIARNKTNESLSQIASAFNKGDHTSVMHAVEKISEEMESSPTVRNYVENIMSKL